MSKAYTIGSNACTINNRICAYTDQYNPLDLPPYTIRCRFVEGYTPICGDTQILVDAEQNIWDIYKAGNDWHSLFNIALSTYDTNLIEVLGANTTNVTHMENMFAQCRSLTSIQLFDTSNVGSMMMMCAGCHSLTSLPLFNISNVSNMNFAFMGCINVESGALALYNQASTQTNPPTHIMCFRTCGINTVQGAAELAQIPSDWK